MPTLLVVPRWRTGWILLSWKTALLLNYYFFSIVPISHNETGPLMDRIQSDSSFKGALAQSFIKVLYHNSMRNRSERLVICREVVSAAPIVIYTRKNYFLLEAINAQIEKLKSSGLINYWRRKFLNKNFMTRRTHSGPRILTVDNLSGALEIWLLGCIVGSAVFVIEKCLACF